MRTGDPSSIATVFSPDTPESGSSLTLGSDAAAHLRALRLDVGDQLRVIDGRGTVASAAVRKVGKDIAQVDVQSIQFVERESEIHLLLPIADKDRMLWLAEKAVEIGVWSWRPVMWKRSRSVASRGDGPAFQRRLHARMVSALEQSGSAWLPDIFPPGDVERAIAAAPTGARYLLDARADAPFPRHVESPVILVIGPEGGLEREEFSSFEQNGFKPVKMAANTLRFETAGLAALVLARSALIQGDANE